MAERRPVIAGNWKMHKTPDQAVVLVRELLPLVAGIKDRDLVVCPPFPALTGVAGVLAGSNLALGAQDMHWEREGAFTGEVSAPMLVASGCRYVILGHSERRRYFGEDDRDVQRKVRAALAHDLIPIVCVGETLAQREEGQTRAVVSGQLAGALAGLTADDVARLVLAYEPVWAIGTGQNAAPEDAQEVIAYLRECLARSFGPQTAAGVRIQYGGSVKPDNIAVFLAQPDIDGALVGGASLTAASFAAIAGAPG